MTPWVQRFLIANVLMFFVQQTVPGVTSAEAPIRLPPSTMHRAVTQAPSSMRTGEVSRAMSRA